MYTLTIVWFTSHVHTRVTKTTNFPPIFSSPVACQNKPEMWAKIRDVSLQHLYGPNPVVNRVPLSTLISPSGAIVYAIRRPGILQA